MRDKEVHLSNGEDEEIEDNTAGEIPEIVNPQTQINPTQIQEGRTTGSKRRSLPPPIIPFVATTQRTWHDMDTVSTMALEYLSMAATDYLGYDTWIEQERPVHSDSAMNIGAIMSHLAEYLVCSVFKVDKIG